MTSFDDEFAAGAYPELVTQFGGTTTYTKGNGTTRTIDAIVVTNPLELQAFGEDIPAASAIVRTKNSATRGILASEIVPGRDSVDVSIDGHTATAKVIMKILSDNGGVTSVLCY